MAALILLSALAVLAIIAVKIVQKIIQDKDLPPGPWGLPIVGYLPFLYGKQIAEVFGELGRKFGPIFSLRLGGKLVVVLNDSDAIKDSLVKQAVNRAGRPHDMIPFTTLNKGTRAPP